ALLGGVGLVAIGKWLAQFGADWARRGARVAAILLLAGSTLGLTTLCAAVADGFNSYGADDASAMRWLSAHTLAGEIVANDGSTDAGIWVPYKAHAGILMPQAS